MNQPSSGNFWKWIDLRGRQAGTWGFILNRITALGLTLYLFIHLVILSQLARGPEAYSSFLEIIHNPIFVFGEWLVVIAGLYHGINGIRIGLNSFGIGVPRQKAILYGVVAIALVCGLFFAVKMFTS
jgi:succinate dehydrogenase / fumarate reductase cytochrome b subunit